MKRILVLALTGLIIIGLFAVTQSGLLVPARVLAKPTTSATDIMLMANDLYDGKQFAQAAQAYQQLVNQGFADSALFYNLGNAYFKQGDLGRAIVSYRRAERLAPRDPDIQANLDLARGLAVDRIDEDNNHVFLGRLAQVTQVWLTTDELALVALGLWFMFAFLFVAFTNSRGGSHLREGLQYALIVASILLAVGVLSLADRLYVDEARSEGVIVASEVDVTSGPSSQHVTEFTLHSGTEVSLIETRGSWMRLALPGGRFQGWVPASAVEAVTG